MKRKNKILLASYTLAALAALSFAAWMSTEALGGSRRTADASAFLAFEECSRTVRELSEALDKSAYVTDSRMASRVCAEAYARAEAAEAAMATLPFATQELEQLAAFLNVAGDYAYSLCGQQETLSEEQVGQFRRLAQTASSLAGELDALREQLYDGSLGMDRREKRLQNVQSNDPPLLSASLLKLERDFTPPEMMSYDGCYGAAEEEDRGYLTEAEMQRLAADFLGVSEEELQPLYDYEGIDGRRCYRWEDTTLCVNRCGVQSCSTPRLVGEAAIGEEQARAAAEDFLDKRGYGALRLCSSALRGNVLDLRYAAEQDGALCEDDCLHLSVALDDGSVLLFDAGDYRGEKLSLNWNVDEESARRALPEGLTVTDSRRCVRRSPGGEARPCYGFDCKDSEGRSVRICVDAETGLQREIELTDPQGSRRGA